MSWVIIGAPGSVKMVVGMSTFSTPGGHWTGKIGVPVGGWSRTRCYRERDRDGVREAEKVIKMTVWLWSLHCGALVRAAVPVTFTREGGYTRQAVGADYETMRKVQFEV